MNSSEEIEDFNSTTLPPEEFNQTSTDLASISPPQFTPDDLNWTLSLGPWSSASVYIFYNFVFLASILGNFFVIYTIISSRRLQSITNIFLLSLALGDFLESLLVLPFSHLSIMLQFWPFGSFLCYFLSPIQSIISFFYAYTLMALSGDRYLCISHPGKPRLTKGMAITIVGFAWAIGFLISVPIMSTTVFGTDPNTNKSICYQQWDFDMNHIKEFQERKRLFYNIALLGMQFFLPVGCIIYFFTKIFKIFHKESLRANDNRDKILLQNRKKSIKLTFYIALAFIIAWAPYNILILYYALFGAKYILYNSFNEIFLLAHMLAQGHSMFNPILYAIVAPDFRIAFRELFHTVMSPGRRMPTSGGNTRAHNQAQNKIWRFLPFVPPTARTLRHHLLVEGERSSSTVELSTFFHEGNRKYTTSDNSSDGSPKGEGSSRV